MKKIMQLLIMFVFILMSTQVYSGELETCPPKHPDACGGALVSSDRN